MMECHDIDAVDVLVCGAGSAGFCAAVQAARAGMKTALVERYGMPGGIMTVMGNNDVALFYAHKRQVIRGIGWEFVVSLADRGFAHIPDMTKDVPHSQLGVKVNIPAAGHWMDEMLLSAGVRLYYGQPAVAVETEGRKVQAVIISTKGGLRRIRASMVIDCTGDGDICAWAGAAYECGDAESGILQPGTVRYYFQAAQVGKVRDEKTLSAFYETGELLEEDTMRHPIKTLRCQNGNNVNHISGFNGADSESKMWADIEGRRSVYRVMKALKKAETGLTVENIAPETGMRETRRILGDWYITAEEYERGISYPDGICYSFYPIDLHQDGMKEIHQIFLTDGQVPQIPLSALIVRDLDNVYVAGRCASGDRLANSAFRVKASCMAMGQAAGAAAAVAVRENGGQTRGCDLERIKAILRADGAIVP